MMVHELQLQSLHKNTCNNNNRLLSVLTPQGKNLHYNILGIIDTLNTTKN